MTKPSRLSIVSALAVALFAAPWLPSAAHADDERRVGEIRLKAALTKTKQARTIGLEVSPALRAMLSALKLAAAADEPFVFGGATPYSVDLVESARARLLLEYGAPKCDWQSLRSTAATFLTNAPGIFGAATVYLSARQLGHSVAVAERHYLGVHRGIARDARTLENAMQVEPQVHALTKAGSVTRRLSEKAAGSKESDRASA